MSLHRRIAHRFTVGLLVALASSCEETPALTTIKIAITTRTITAGLGAPFAVAQRMGWFAQEGIKVDLLPVPGSTDAAKSVATGSVLVALLNVEPVAMLRAQGVPERIFYTACQTNTTGIAVPVDSPIKTLADLKGKNIGVASMASSGVIVARALAAAGGLNPDTDITFVVVGEGAQPALMLKRGDVQALSQFDTQYALTEIAGVPLRLLDLSGFERHPAHAFVALESTIASKRRLLVGLGRAYAKAQVFATANPEAAVRMLYEVFPQTRAVGTDEATAIRNDMKVLRARAAHWQLAPAAVTRWGESSVVNYRDYLTFLSTWGILKQPANVEELVTNELIDEINRFDHGAASAAVTPTRSP